MKKTMISALAVLLMAEVSMGVDIRVNTGGGFWDNTAVWSTFTIPTTNDQVRINRNIGINPTIVTVTNTATCRDIQIGVDESGKLIITNGAKLTVTGQSGNWSGIAAGGLHIASGESGTVIVDGGGSIEVLAGQGWLMGVTATPTAPATLIINNGSMDLGTNHFRQIYTNCTAKTYVNAGGSLKVGILSLAAGLIEVNEGTLTVNNTFNVNATNTNPYALDIRKTGKLIVNGDASEKLNALVAAGRLLGNGAVSNVEITVEATELLTNTTVIALTPAVPNYVDLDLGVATNKIVLDGYTVGTLTPSYVRGVVSGLVLSQDPVAGDKTTQALDPINLTHQEIAPNTTNNCDWLSSADGNWTTDANWSTGVAPVRETQSLKARIMDPTVECVLSSAVGVAWLTIDGGNVKLASGADLYAGKMPLGGSQWTSVGYAKPSTLTIEEGAVMQTVSYLITGFGSGGGVNPGTSTINLNGGDLTVGGNIQMGNADLFSQATINVSSGSVLRCSQFKYNDGISNGTYSVVHMYDGQVIQDLNQTNILQRLIDDGGIVIHSPAYSISEIGGKAVLQTLDVGFDAWAAQYLPTVIGSATSDYDNDGFSNLYEYALNGNPTNSATGGTAPALSEEAGVLKFTFVERNDDPKLTYSVETTDSLTTGTWEAVGYTTETSRVANGEYDTVIHTIPVTDAKKFVRLKVVQTP